MALIIISNQDAVHAQHALQKIYTSADAPISVYWSSSGQQLSFTLMSSSPLVDASTDRGWFLYDVHTKSLVNSAKWPLYPPLSSEILNSLNLFKGPHGEESFVFQSPDGRYIVFVTRQPSQNGEDTILFDKIMGNRATIPGVSTQGNALSLKGFQVLWNNTSDAFLIMGIQVGSPELYAQQYVYNFTRDLAQLRTRNPYPTLDNRDCSLFKDRTFALSDDGNYVLAILNCVIHGTATQDVVLTRVDLADPNKSVFLFNVDARKENIIAAAFEPENTQKILYLADSGLFEFDLVSHQVERISTDVTAKWAQHATFSPRGDKLALIHDTSTMSELYLLDLTDVGSTHP